MIRNITLRKVGVSVLMALSMGSVSASHYVAAPTVTYAGTYAELNVGYASREWSSAINLAGLNNVTWKNGGGGLIGGADAGYQFNKYVAVELGWEYLPEMKLYVNTVERDRVQSWVAYAGPKLMAPLFCSLFVFAKGGLSYVYNKNYPPIAANSLIGGAKSNYWSGFAALGLQWYLTRRFSVSAQAAYVPGYSVSAPTNAAFNVPETFYYTAVLGYKFML